MIGPAPSEAGRRLVRQKSLRAFKSLPPAKVGDKVRAMTGRSRGASMRRIIDDLNPMLRGWFGYFKQAHPTTFRDIDGFIRRRLRSFLLKQNKRVAFGLSPDINKRWPNAYFAEAGLIALQVAWQSARRSR